MIRFSILVVAVLLLSLTTAGADQSESLLRFDTDFDLAACEIGGGPGVLSDQHVTQGRGSLRVWNDQSVRFFRLPADWSGYDVLELDMFSASPDPVSLDVLIGDRAWQANSTYWNRYNGTFSLRPGANRFSIPLGGLYRGEVGSRYNDLKTDIDISQIVRLDLGFSPTGKRDYLYLDSLRLTKWSRPALVYAFDFGPAGQAVAPGFTPVSPDVDYSDTTGWGWDPTVRPGRAWDVTFPTRLLQDSIDLGGATFRAKLRPGAYHMLVFFEPLGYWDGEQARYSRRTVRGPGWQVVQEHEKWGKLDFAYHFQDTEPLPGADLWAVYMDYLFKPAEADVALRDGVFELTVEADGPGAKRLAGLILYPTGNARAAQWVSEALAEEREEFRSRAVELPLPQTKDPAPASAADRARGCVLFAPPVEQDVYFSTLPTAEQARADLETFAARGQLTSLTFAVRPLRDLGAAKLAVSDLVGKETFISSQRITLSVVRHLPTRSLGSLMYRVSPRYLVAASEVTLPGDITRQFWVTVRVPKDAAPDMYQGEITLKPAGQPAITIPVRLRVLPFELDEADFTTGFFGIEPNLPVQGPAHDELQRGIFRMLADHGMTSFTGGPPIVFSGFNSTGQPKLDFARADAFMAEVKKAGFHREFNNYGGFIVTGLHDQGYVKGETGAALEKQYGMPYEEILRRVWEEVEIHSAQEEWLPFTYHMCDETRVLEVAREQLELMKLLKRASPWLQTTGSYSVSFAPTQDPLELALQDFFRTLDSSQLNNHDDLVMAKARELGKKVYIYNQGQGRYSFGLYQWSERAKGVAGRYQWISFIRHGCEYLDLDGREPDTGVIFYAADGLRSTPALERAGEGMNDFRYLQTLENLAAAAEDATAEPARQAAAEAREFLARIASSIAINQRQKPDGLDLDAIRREAADRILALRPMVAAEVKPKPPAPPPAPNPTRGRRLPPFPQ